jgi:hypothetical protein
MEGKIGNRRRNMWKGTMFADEIGNLSRRCLGYFSMLQWGRSRDCRRANMPIRTCTATRLRPGGAGRSEFHSSAARNRGDRIRQLNREAVADIPTCSSTSESPVW